MVGLKIGVYKRRNGLKPTLFRMVFWGLRQQISIQRWIPSLREVNWMLETGSMIEDLQTQITQIYTDWKEDSASFGTTP